MRARCAGRPASILRPLRSMQCAEGVVDGVVQQPRGCLLLNRWLKANNIGQSTFNMMLEASHVESRRRALETSVGGRLLIDCDLAPAMQARWAVEHLCSHLTCARETMRALVLDTLSIIVIVMCIFIVFEALYCPHMGRAPCTVPPTDYHTEWSGACTHRAAPAVSGVHLHHARTLAPCRASRCC